MKKVLLPTDFSENAFNAIKYAIELFSDENCIFILLNTYTPILYDSQYLKIKVGEPTLMEIYKNNSLRGLDNVERRIKRHFPTQKHIFRKVSSFNLLSDEIQELVKEEKIDLVVMGTKGATGAQEILLGSHTVHVIRKVNCPLLAIPSLCDYTPPRQILYATDFESGIMSLLNSLKELIRTHHSVLHIVHVELDECLSDEQVATKKQIAKEFKDLNIRFYNIREKTVPKAIHDFQKRHHIDMLVLVNNKRSFFDNLFFKPIVDKIGFQVKVPFLVIPTEKKS